MRARITLDKLTDVQKFVEIATKCGKNVVLTNEKRDFIVSATSLLGALYSMEWGVVYCECDEDIYSEIKDFLYD